MRKLFRNGLKMLGRYMLWFMVTIGFSVTVVLSTIALNTSSSIEWVDVNTNVFRGVTDRYVKFAGKERGFFLEFVNVRRLNKCELVFYTSNNDITVMVESFRLKKRDEANNVKTKTYRITDGLMDDTKDRTKIVVPIDIDFSPINQGESLSIEVYFKPNGQDERCKPLHFAFSAQKVMFVDMPGW